MNLFYGGIANKISLVTSSCSLQLELGETATVRWGEKSKLQNLFITYKSYGTCCSFPTLSLLQFFSSYHCSLWPIPICLLTMPSTNLISGTLYSIPGMFFYRRSYDIPIWALLKCYFHRELLSNSHVLFYCLLHLSSKHHS